MIFFETEADLTEWFPMPLHWTAHHQNEIDKWSATCAEIVYQRHKKWWRRPNRLALANQFLQLIEAHPNPKIPADQIFLYGGDPRRIPQPFYALAMQSDGEDREAGLRTIVQATEENPVRPPDVGAFDSERIGQGLRCLRYFGDPGDLAVSLNYGWWSEEHQVYASVRTVTDEVGWLATNLDIFDDFARSIWLNPDPE
ncbi:hypothetical protein [Streptomyces sporangiiformans]|uniref:Uncharacterized protein n=1 Tax=Streptomyces sporangiiformans TaxID=2315329 RepID=A0A505DMC2_9ACTN|nr:hypothetical protein [Streptomyces sporangiiformans]TPQ22076.1 hypothetical protein FGD71_011835 [Streptomyces sporangiiformans]